MYGVYSEDDDEMYYMSLEQVWEYIKEFDSGLFQNYSVNINGDKVLVYEVSAGANGKLDDEDIESFFYNYSESGLIIRKITKQ